MIILTRKCAFLGLFKRAERTLQTQTTPPTDRIHLGAAQEPSSDKNRSRNTNNLIMGIFTAGDTTQIMLEVPS